MGTNGEIALGNKDKILVASTAAGPAFEGGNITAGMGSIPGAIKSVEIQDQEIQTQTIQGLPPIGICGSGVVELTAELKKMNFMDETGLLIDKYFEEGVKLATGPLGEDIIFTQKDVRELQMAKAAIRAGLEVLIKRYSLQLEALDKIFLAGGLGHSLNIDKAIRIGLLPEVARQKVVPVGNTSLKGAVSALRDENFLKSTESIIEHTRVIQLGRDEDFNTLYMENMYF